MAQQEEIRPFDLEVMVAIDPLPTDVGPTQVTAVQQVL